MWIKVLMSVIPFLSVGHAMPFDYDLHLQTLEGSHSRTLVCLHGYGGNFQLADEIKKLAIVNSTLVSFNLPDHDLHSRNYDPTKASFGTIHELLPAFYVLKTLIIDKGNKSVDIYARSAGGGALVNLLAVLNTTTYDQELANIGIGHKEKTEIKRVIENGIILLDVPLKSIEEIIALRGSNEEFEILAKTYRENHFRPIDSLTLLKGLKLNIIVYFENPDEILSNRDDDLFIERLKESNQGTTTVIVGSEQGHAKPHQALLQSYAKIINTNL